MFMLATSRHYVCTVFCRQALQQQLSEQTRRRDSEVHKLQVALRERECDIGRANDLLQESEQALEVSEQALEVSEQALEVSEQVLQTR